MSTPIIVHFGMPKTGSKSIQYFLEKNASRFHIRYLSGAGTSINASRMLQEAFGSLWKRLRVNVYRDLIDGWVKESCTAEHMSVISSEYISNMRRNEFRAFNEIFSHNEVKIKYCGYIRAPTQFMESAFQQALKQQPRRISLKQLPYPDYRRRFEKFHSISNRHDVIYWAFEPVFYSNRCVVKDFMSKIGVEITTPIPRRNVSLSADAIGLLFIFRNFAHPQLQRELGTTGDRALVRKLQSLPGARLKFHPDLIDSIMVKISKDVDWMEAKSGISLQSMAFPAPNEASRVVSMDEELVEIGLSQVSWLEQLIGRRIGCVTDRRSPEAVAKGVAELRAIESERVGSRGNRHPDGTSVGGA